MLYGDIDLGQHFLKWLLGIHLRAIWNEIPINSIPNICLKMAPFKITTTYPIGQCVNNSCWLCNDFHVLLNCIIIDVHYTETDRSSGWLPWSSLETLKTCFIVSTDGQGSHSENFSISVYGWVPFEKIEMRPVHLAPIFEFYDIY